jgi:hypothetical protein
LVQSPVFAVAVIFLRVAVFEAVFEAVLEAVFEGWLVRRMARFVGRFSGYRFQDRRRGHGLAKAL